MITGRRIFRYWGSGLCLLVCVSLFLSGCGLPWNFWSYLPYGPIGFIDKSGKLVIDLSIYHPGGFSESPGHPNRELNAIHISDFSAGLSILQFWNSIGSGSGFIDENGKLTLLPGGMLFQPPSEGLFAFRSNSKKRKFSYGFANRKGEVLIKPVYECVRDFSEGAAAVCTKDGWEPEEWFYIDKSGKKLFKQTFEGANSFSEGIATVQIEKKFGAIDKSGHEIVPAIFDRVFPASNGIIVAQSGVVPFKPTGDSSVTKIERIYFDKAGNKLFSKQVSVTDRNPDCRQMTLCSMGSYGRPLHLSNSPAFFNGLAIVQDGTKYGYMNKRGEIVIPAIYDFAFPFSGDFAVVYSFEGEGRIAFINRRGERFTEFKYGDATDFSEGLAAVTEGEHGPYGFIDTNGKIKIPLIFCAAHKFREGKALVGWQYW